MQRTNNSLQKFIIHCFAAFGFCVVIFFGLHALGAFNVGGSVDKRNDLFMKTHKDFEKQDTGGVIIPLANTQNNNEITQQQNSLSPKVILCKISASSDKYPTSSDRVLKAYQTTNNTQLVDGMLYALTTSDQELASEFKKCESRNSEFYGSDQQTGEAVKWLDSAEWNVLRTAFTRDSEVINKVAKELDISPRLLITPIIGEQLRFFTSARSTFKNYLEPAKQFIYLSKFSYGLAGMKPETAERIEQNLKNQNSPFYLGEKYESILDYPEGVDPNIERINRIDNKKDHYYVYLYVGLYLKQFEAQWKKAGYPVDGRPEILATLYNLGHNRSIPKAKPDAGGAVITIDNISYTFGGLAYDFYWSGEMQELFPY